MDYTSGPYTVTIPAGQTTATFDVTINNDNILEGDEDYVLTISLSSPPTGVTVGTPDQATVTIKNDDCKSLSLLACVSVRDIMIMYVCTFHRSITYRHLIANLSLLGSALSRTI